MKEILREIVTGPWTRGSRKCRNVIKKIIQNSYLVELGARLTSPSVVILRYHSVQDSPELFSNSIGDGIVHRKSAFKEQMEIVARCFTPITLDDILLFIKNGKGIPRKAVAVTFDDGFVDNYEIAAPILDSLGFRAAFYVTVGSVETRKPPWFYRLRRAFFTTRRRDWLDSKEGQVWKLDNQEGKNAAFMFACEQCARLTSDTQELNLKRIEDVLGVDPPHKADNVMMNWEQIKQLHKAGHIIGSHTLTHPNLARIEETDLRGELNVSKQIIEDKLGTSIIHFSYPSPILEPHWTEATIKATREAGYQTAVTCTPGSVRINTNPLSLNRIWVPQQKNEFLWNLDCTFLGRKM